MANSYAQGEHICGLFETEEEQIAMAAEYLGDGLRKGERAFYVAQSDAALGRFAEALKEIRMDAAAAVKRGALIVATHKAAHLPDGCFDCERMLRLLNDAVESALNDGFIGLRTCGDMSWLLQEPAGAHQILEYEALLNQFFQGVRAAGMCQYDRRRLQAHLVDHALATHTSAVIDAQHKLNPFYRAPAIAMNRVAKPDDVAWKVDELRRRA